MILFELINKPNGEFHGLIRYAKTIATIKTIEGSKIYPLDSKELNDVIYSLQESGHKFTGLEKSEYLEAQKTFLGIELYISF